MTPETSNEQNQEVREASRLPGWMRSVSAFVVKRIIHNWPWKLLALFLAVCLWAGLITQDPTLTRERVFAEVPLGTTGVDTLRRNGMIVLSGLEDTISVRLRADVPQREYNTVTYSNFNPRVDLTRITRPGEQEIKISSTSTVAYGTVKDIYPSTVTIVVDEYVTNYRIPVSVNMTGTYPEGFYGSTFSLDPSVVAVSGPKSVVDQISRIHVDYNASALAPEAGTLITALPMRFVDRSGNDVVSDLLEVTSSGVVLRSINVKQTLFPVREMPVSQADLITGEPARGYRVADVSVSPAVIRAAGEQSVLDDLGSIFASSAVDVDGTVESFTASVRLRKPSELEYISAGTIDVAVTIEPVIISTSLSSVRVSARGTDDTLRTSLGTGYVSAIITGPQLIVEKIRPSEVSAYVDVSGLAPGEYTLPLELHVEDTDTHDLQLDITPATIKVNISER